MFMPILASSQQQYHKSQKLVFLELDLSPLFFFNLSFLSLFSLFLLLLSVIFNMSHPIMNNMEFIQQRKESGGYEEDDENSFGSEKQTDPGKWHSILRRMSINIQRDEGTPDNEIISGRSVAHPTDHERALMLNIPHYSSSTEDLSDETIEDNTLPTVEEIITDYIDNTNNALHKQQPSYFENPFDTDTASTDDTVFVQPDTGYKKMAHPLMKIETAEKKRYHHGISSSNSMRNDSAQGTKKKMIGILNF